MDKYTPDDADVRTEYLLAHQGLDAQLDAGEAYDRWLADHDERVGRAAVREVLDDIIDAWTGKDSTKDTREAAEALMFVVRPQFVDKIRKLEEARSDANWALYSDRQGGA